MKKAKVLSVVVIAAFILTTGVIAYAAAGNSTDNAELTAVANEQQVETQIKTEKLAAQTVAYNVYAQDLYEMADFTEWGSGHGFEGEMTDEQKAEMETKMNEWLAQALADGKITQEQYDTIINGIRDFKNGEMPDFGEWDFGSGFKGEMTDEQKAEMETKMNDWVAKALADGKITQEQYDTIINSFQDFQNGEIPNFTNAQKAEMMSKLGINVNSSQMSQMLLVFGGR